MSKSKFLLALKCLVALALLSAASLCAKASLPTQPQINVTAYVIHIDLDPSNGRLSATTAVTFTALEDLHFAVFGLNSTLHVQSVTDSANATLTTVSNAVDATVTVTPTATLPRGSTSTWTFIYDGKPSPATNPVTGSNFIQMKEPVSVLLYPGRWFPLSIPGLYTDRFTSEIHVTVPAGEVAFGSSDAPAVGRALKDGRTEFNFYWTKPSFPGNIIAGKFLAPVTAPGSPNVRVYVTQQNRQRGEEFAGTVGQENAWMDDEFGDLDSGEISVVELPKDAVAAAWAPGLIAVNPSHVSARLLANMVAHQWWGALISPATPGDAWITNGMSRYAELMYVQDSSGQAAFDRAVTDVQAAALAYDTEPLASLNGDPFSPQFQSATLEKGAMIFHMLRWEMGDLVFKQFLQALVRRYAHKSIRTTDVETLAETVSKLPLTSFFSQWVNGTGAPAYTNTYSVFRLGSNKGFRTDGSLSQDLDLFSMPVELRLETQEKTIDRRVDLFGPAAQYSIETSGQPVKITVDPDNWLLKSTPQLLLRANILLGQQSLMRGDAAGAIAAYQQALAIDRGSSLANFRLAEVYLSQKNYQAAANSFRDCLRGDADPKWTEVWSHINLGKIFDIAGQRERAVNEYRLAIRTADNTQGAINEAHALTEKPYKPESDSTH